MKEDKAAKKSQTELGVSNHVVAATNQMTYLTFIIYQHNKHFQYTEHGQTFNPVI